jgi:hypothetical protein
MLTYLILIFLNNLFIQQVFTKSQVRKSLLLLTLVPSYYCLYSLYNKIRNKGKIVSAGY